MKGNLRQVQKLRLLLKIQFLLIIQKKWNLKEDLEVFKVQLILKWLDLEKYK